MKENNVHVGERNIACVGSDVHLGEGRENRYKVSDDDDDNDDIIGKGSKTKGAAVASSRQ